MHGAVIDNAQSQRALNDFDPVQLGEANAPADPGGVVDRDFISRGLTANRHRERRPTFGNARVDSQEAPRMRSPSMLSTPARYSHPAEPVYQVQPPRPT